MVPMMEGSKCASAAHYRFLAWQRDRPDRTHPQDRGLRRQDTDGRPTRRLSRGGTEDVRISDQSQGRQGARHRGAADRARARRRDGRMMLTGSYLLPILSKTPLLRRLMLADSVCASCSAPRISLANYDS